MNRATVSVLAMHTTVCQSVCQHCIQVSSTAHTCTAVRFSLLNTYSLVLVLLFLSVACTNSTNINTKTLKYTSLPLSRAHAPNTFPGDALPLHTTLSCGVCVFVCEAEEERAVCTHVWLWVSSCLCLLVFNCKCVCLPVSILVFVYLQHLCVSTLLHKHLCTNIFSEGGNNLIVWVNPKWAELQKQSFSEHLQLENLTENEGTFTLKQFFHSS